MEEQLPEKLEAVAAVPEVHECPYCEMTFLGYRSLKTHIGHHFRKGDVRRKGDTNVNPIVKRKKKKKAAKWGTSTQRVSCDICGIVCSNRHSLLRHHMVHTGQKPYKCETCGKGFTANWNLKMHKCIGRPIDAAAFTCANCGEWFSDETSFNAHACGEHHQYDTPETGTPSPSASTSYETPKEEPTGEQVKWDCRFCDRTFATPKGLGGHMSVHRPQIDTPESTPSSGSNYEIAKVEPSEGPGMFECQFCHRQFNCARGLARHVSVHRPQVSTSENTTPKVSTSGNTIPSPSYQISKMETREKSTWDCPFCDRVFLSSNGLGGHMSLHRHQSDTLENSTYTPSIVTQTDGSQQTRWECQFCEKVFVSRKGLCGHMSVHRFRTGTPECATPSPSPANHASPSPLLADHSTSSSSLANQPTPSSLTSQAMPSFANHASPSPSLANRTTPSPLLTSQAIPPLFNHATPSPSLVNRATPSPSLSNRATPSPSLANRTTPSPSLANRASPSPSLANRDPINKEPKQTQWDCHYCKKIFSSPNALGGHMRAHRLNSNALDSVMPPLVSIGSNHPVSGDQPTSTEWECQFCAQLFLELKSLNDHLFQVHNYQNDIATDTPSHLSPHECLVCHRMFTNAMALGGHMSVHKMKPPSKPRSPKPYVKSNPVSPHKSGKPEVPCTVCAKVYQYKASLKRHMSSHAGELGPFKCPHCEETQLLMDDLLIHMEVHQLSKCELCFMTFEHPSLLDQHMRYRHRELELSSPGKHLPLPEPSPATSPEHILELESSNTETNSKPASGAETTISSVTSPNVDNNGVDWNLRAVLTSPPMFSPKPTSTEGVSAANALDSDPTVKPQWKSENDSENTKEAFQKSEEEQKQTSPPKERKNCFQCKICHQLYPKGLSFIRHKAWHTRRGDKAGVLINDPLSNPESAVTLVTHSSERTDSVQTLPDHSPERTDSIKTLPEHSEEKSDAVNMQGVNVSMRGQVKSILYPCPVCNQKYTMIHNMQRHLKHAHGTKRTEPLRETSTTVTVSDGLPQMKPEPVNQQEGMPEEKKPGVVENEKGADSIPTWKRYTRGIFKCPVCKRPFTWYHNMKTHIKNFHHSTSAPATKSLAKFGPVRPSKFPPPTHKIVDGKKRVICGICSREFVNNSGFGMHMRVHRLKAAKSANLNVAINSAPKQSHTINSAPEHSQVENAPHQSEMKCQSEVPKKQTDRPGPNRYFCPTCNEGFFYYCRLKRHINQQHNSMGISIKPPRVLSPTPKPTVKRITKFFYCRFCPRHFLNTGTLKNHEKWKHLRTGGKSSCLVPILPKPPTEVYSDPHKTVVKLEPGVAATTHDTLNTTPPVEPLSNVSRFVCRICSRTFSNQGNLMRHIKLHSGHKLLNNPASTLKRPNTNVVTHKIATVYRDGLPGCGECGKLFKAKSMLERHKRCHTGEKPFKCPVCETCFTVSWSRLVHVRNTHPTYPTANLKAFDRHEVRTSPTPTQLVAARQTPADPILPMNGKTQYCIKNIGGRKVFCCPSCGKSFNTYQGLNGHKRHCGNFKQDRLDSINKTNNTPHAPTILETLRGPIVGGYSDNVYDDPFNDNKDKQWNCNQYKDMNGVGDGSGYSTYGESDQYIYGDSNGYRTVRIKEEPQDDYPSYGLMSNNVQNTGNMVCDAAQGDNAVVSLGGSKLLDDAMGSMQALSKAIDKFAQSRVLSYSDSEFDDTVQLSSDAEEAPSSSYYRPDAYGPSTSHDSPSASYRSKDQNSHNDESHPGLSSGGDSNDMRASTSIATKTDAPPTKKMPQVFKLLTRTNLHDADQNTALATIKQSVLNDRLRGESGFVLASIHSPLNESSSEGEVIGYLVGHPRGFGPFCCPVCHRRFPTPSLFANHLIFHVDKCPDASLLGNVFRPANDQLQPNDCNCHLFGLTFTDCPKCVEGYTDLDDLKQHVIKHVKRFLERQAAELNLY